MNVPLLDLKAEYQRLKKEIDSAIISVLESGIFVLGPEGEKLEKAVAEFCESPHALAVSNGTDALLLALLTIDIQPGDEVITSAFSFFATSEAISFLKATPVFVDILPDTFCIDPKKIEQAITPKTRAIMPVHIFGQSAEMDPIMEIAKKKNLYVIEDACQAIGAEYKGKKCGSIGDMGVLSFYPSKNLGTYGDGGMLFLKKEADYISARQYRTHGEYPKSYRHKKIGMNARLSELLAAILNVKLPYLREWNEKRREKASFYTKLPERENLIQKISPPRVAANQHPIFHAYVTLTNEKEAVRNYLKDHGIQTANYFPTPLPHLDCYKENHRPGDFPVAEEVCRRSLSLPIFPQIASHQQEYVIQKIKEFFRRVVIDQS
ncbi:MAG: DegT/DnrJ/EryC1/StrS family aminotransferase [Deltaproteobacteria bacterium]